MKNEVKKWLGPVNMYDDFGDKITDEFIDGKTHMGQWAIMTPYSWGCYGFTSLGVGLGQRYKKQPDKTWVKIEG